LIDNEGFENLSWETKTPYEVRDAALNDVVNAYTSNLAKENKIFAIEFKTRLVNKAREHPNCRVIICGEEYTSQTCRECGYLHRKIGGAKEFKCPGCNQESDRDFNAARNILLKGSNL
jgi:transposase